MGEKGRCYLGQCLTEMHAHCEVMQEKALLEPICHMMSYKLVFSPECKFNVTFNALPLLIFSPECRINYLKLLGKWESSPLPTDS